MNESEVAGLDGLPAPVRSVLTMFLASTREALSSDLVSAVLFGSAAEGRLAPTSDVNLLLVLRDFAPDRIGRMRDALLNAEAAIKLRVMFLLESEVAPAAELFGQKFADILRRHRTIFGKDVLATLKVPRNAEIFRLRQILLNLVLRLREAYSARAHRSEQAARILADALGPLRRVRDPAGARRQGARCGFDCGPHRRRGFFRRGRPRSGNADPRSAQWRADQRRR
jgi:predicted nucleotidyltransferase